MNDKSARFPKGTRIKDTAPERRAILDLLEEQGKPLQRKAIVERLGVVSDGAREILRRCSARRSSNAWALSRTAPVRFFAGG
jgi:hypothetical protein